MRVKPARLLSDALDDEKYKRLALVRGILYGVAIAFAVAFPHKPPGEKICQQTAFLAPQYIGERLELIDQEDGPVVYHGGVCNTYFGFPLVYIADIYDAKPAYVSLTRLAFNIAIFCVTIETLIFLARLAVKRIRRRNVI